MSKPLIGLEIEVPFSFYFPDYFEKHRRLWQDFDNIHVMEDLAEAEIPVLQKLEDATKELGLKRGKDRYWEFVFPATTDLNSHWEKVKRLMDMGLMPHDRRLAIHLTASDEGLDIYRAFSILMFLELEYLTKERVVAGFHEVSYKRSWNRKGKAGIRVKDNTFLDHAEEAYEFRTLSVKPDDVGNMFYLLEDLFNDVAVVDKAKRITAKMGLPWKQWSKDEFMIFSQFLKAR